MITLPPRSRTITLFILTTVCIVAALIYNGRHSELYVVSGITALLLATILLLVTERSDFEFGLPGLFLFCLFAWSAIAIGWSHIPYSSIMDLGALASCVLFYIVWRLLPDDLRNQKTQWYLIIGGACYALIMIGQALLGFRPTGSLVNPNSSAGFLNLLWPAAAVLYIQSPATNRRTIIMLLAVVVTLTAMNLPGSRGALIGAAAAMLIVTYFAAYHCRAPLRAGILFGAFFFSLALAEVLYGGVFLGLERMASPTLEGTSRFTIWTASWEMVQEHPWLGFGPGVFWLAYDAFRLPNDGSSGFFAHNDYLQFWIERGLPGLMLLIAVGLAALWVTYRTFRSSEQEHHAPEPHRGIVVTSIAAIAATAMHSLVSFSLHLLPFLIILGIHLGRIDNLGEPRWRIALPDFRDSIIAKSCLLLVLIPLAHFLMVGISLAYSERGSEQVVQDRFADAAQSFTTARAIWSLPDVMWYLQANVHIEAMRELDSLGDEQTRRLVREADRLLDGAEARNPYRSTTHMIRGLLRADHPTLTDGSAVEAFYEALTINPRDIEARYSLSQVLERQGRVREALTSIRQGLDLRYPKQADPSPLKRRAAHLQDRINQEAE